MFVNFVVVQLSAKFSSLKISNIRMSSKLNKPRTQSVKIMYLENLYILMAKR